MKVTVSLISLFLTILTFIYSLKIVSCHKACGIDLLKKPQRVLIKQEDENRRVLQQGEWESIRIHLDYSYIENNIGRFKKEDYLALKEKIMPKTQEVFQKLLKVKRIQHKLKLNAPHCETFPIPEKYHDGGEGVDADIVIFVLLDDSGFFAENQIEAAALHCLQHYETLRPIAGYIQFKQDLNVNNSTALDYMAWLAVHEVTHILVLNNALYDDYIDGSTLQPHGYDRIIGTKFLPGGKKMKYVKSKHVLEKAKSHFACDNLEGVPLEYNGGAGTAGAHWSKRYMNTDYMIGDSYGENLISDITIGLFEDSGWYKTDSTLSNLFLWGRDKGCEFFKNKCITQNINELSTLFPKEFCTKLNYPMCSPSNIFRAKCYAKRYQSDLKISERYFNDPRIGGIDPLTDKCPIAFEEKNGQNYYGGSCRVGSNENLGKLEKVCPECACFMSTLKINDDKINAAAESNNKVRLENAKIKGENFIKKIPNYFEEEPELTDEDPNANCYQFKCDNSDLHVIINGISKKCSTNEQIKIEGYKGFIICPDNKVLCHNKFKCKFGCTDKYENNKD